MLREKRIDLVEFEYNDLGKWSALAPDRRFLFEVVRELAVAGYTCFWQGEKRIARVRWRCWTQTRYQSVQPFHSNIACVHRPELVRVLTNTAAGPHQARDR
mmetsp:Transcript_19575/g.43722  ORF Transcript_19575/g.43722 Transcript_19575/m.43722 type:complete len:101 (-) Transcript_19575:59-361(-)